MARNYRTTPGQYLDFVYKVPQEVLLGVIENLDNKIAATEMGAMGLSEKLVGDAIQEDMPRFKEKVTGYQTQIDDIVSAIHENPLQYKKHIPKVSQLSREIKRDWTTGEAAAIFSRKKGYDEMTKQYKETYKDNPLLGNYAVANIGVDPLNYDPVTGTYGSIKGANMVQHVDAKDMTGLINQIVDNIKDTDLERNGLSRQQLTQWEDAWVSGKVVGRQFDEITKLIMSQIPSDVFMSAQQWSNAVAMASGSEPVDEYQVWTENEDGTTSPNLKTQIGSIVFGAAGGRAREDYEILQSVKTKNYDAIAQTNMAYKKKYAKWKDESPGIYAKFTAGESAVISPSYKETKDNYQNNLIALEQAKADRDRLSPDSPGYAENLKSINATINALEKDEFNYQQALDKMDKILMSSPTTTFNWDKEYKEYVESSAKYGVPPLDKDTFRQIVMEGIPENAPKNNRFMRKLSKFFEGTTFHEEVTTDANKERHINGLLNHFNGRYGKAMNRFAKTQEMIYETDHSAYFTGMDSGSYKSIVGGYEELLTQTVSQHFGDFKTLDGIPITAKGEGGIFDQTRRPGVSTKNPYANRDPRKDKITPGHQTIDGNPVFLYSIFDDEGKLLGREKIIASKDVGAERQLLDGLGQQMWKGYENGSKEWADGITFSAISTILPSIERSGIATSDRGQLSLGLVDVTIERNKTTGTLTATMVDPKGGKSSVTARDPQALASEIYKIANANEINQYSNRTAPPIGGMTEIGETEFLYNEEDDD